MHCMHLPYSLACTALTVTTSTAFIRYGIWYKVVSVDCVIKDNQCSGVETSDGQLAVDL